LLQRHTQLFRHDPENGTHGDCFRTVVACILGCDPVDVPHVYDGTDDPTGYQRMRDFLKGKGFRLVGCGYVAGDLQLQDVLNLGAHHSHGLPWLLTGKSRTGVNHVVICQDNEIIHDTSQNSSGIIGPTLEGTWHIEWIVRPVLAEAVS
jgi:hypothetical protein